MFVCETIASPLIEHGTTYDEYVDKLESDI